MSKEINIVLADDHALVRKGLKDVIEEAGFNIVGEAADGEEALRIIEDENPQIAILDIHMPKLNGIEVIKTLKQKKLMVEIIILTMYEKEIFFNRAIDLGVKGYVMKDSALTEIIDAINNVSKGKYFISSSVSELLIKRKQFGSSDDVKTGVSKLTITENKILKMIAANMTSSEIADELFLSVNTVNTHRYNICQKLNLHGPNALFHFILEHPELI